MTLNPTAITDRSADAGYLLAFHTGTHMLDRDSTPYLSLLGHRDLGGDNWTFNGREMEALRFENERGRYSEADQRVRSARNYTLAAIRKANGYRIDVPDGYVTYGEPHYYADCRHTIVVHGPAGPRFDELKRKRWHEVSGYATGYAEIPGSQLMDAIADLALLDTKYPNHPWGLVHVVLPHYHVPRWNDKTAVPSPGGHADTGGIIHIGSMARRRNTDTDRFTNWTLEG